MIGVVIKILSIPPFDKTSASPNVAQHTPTAPAAIWRLAISTDLWVFACGLKAMECC